MTAFAVHAKLRREPDFKVKKMRLVSALAAFVVLASGARAAPGATESLPVVGGTSVMPCGPVADTSAKNFRERSIKTAKEAITAAREQLQEFNKAQYSEREWQRSLKGFRYNQDWIVNGKLESSMWQFQIRADNGRFKCGIIFD